MIRPLIPDWPAPSRVKALITTRMGGVSRSPYASLNLALHVGDDPLAVEKNRALLRQGCGLPEEPFWLHQVHGCGVAEGGRDRPGCEADAVYTRLPGRVCAVLTADCLPLLMADRAGTVAAAVHAGWRGLAAGVVESAIERMCSNPEAWQCLEGDVRRCLLRRFPCGIYYCIERDEIMIYAVMHLSRRPDYWRDRAR